MGGRGFYQDLCRRVFRSGFRQEIGFCFSSYTRTALMVWFLVFFDIKVCYLCVTLIISDSLLGPPQWVGYQCFVCQDRLSGWVSGFFIQYKSHLLLCWALFVRWEVENTQSAGWEHERYSKNFSATSIYVKSRKILSRQDGGTGNTLTHLSFFNMVQGFGMKNISGFYERLINNSIRPRVCFFSL